MHRPTFYNAVGGQNQGGNLLLAQTSKVSARDLPGQLTLKTRQSKPAPLYTDESRVDEQDRQTRKEGHRNKLEEREREYQIKKAREKSIHGPLEALTSDITIDNKVPLELLPYQEENPFPEDSDDEGPIHSRNTQQPSNSRRSPDQSESDSDDDDDEEEALMRELAKIKRDREEEESRKAEELAQQEAVEERSRILKANPLLLTDSYSSDQMGLKRRWDDDVVFRNQVKDAPKPKKRFINDTVRNEFHRKFLTKYIL